MKNETKTLWLVTRWSDGSWEIEPIRGELAAVMWQGPRPRETERIGVEVPA